MRKQLIDTMSKTLEKNKETVLLLGDIGVHGFRHAKKKFPNRVYNIGILEQTTVSLAAGLKIAGFTPTVHTIAPFLIERAYEQIKVDFCYQGLGGNLVTVEDHMIISLGMYSSLPFRCNDDEFIT